MHPRELFYDLFSFLSLTLGSTLLVPQAWLNYKTQSTEGLSPFMLIIWLVASEAPATYFIQSHQPALLTIGWWFYCITSIFILCQIPYYSRLKHLRASLPDVDDPSAISVTAAQTLLVVNEFRRKFVVKFVLLHALSAAGCSLLFYLYNLSDSSAAFSWFTPLFSSTLPSIAFGAGFLPQIKLNFATKSSEGLSVATIVIDLIACFSSIAAIALNRFDLVAIIPYAVIFLFQLFMLFVIFFVFPRKPNNISALIERELTMENQAAALLASEEEKMEAALPSAAPHAGVASHSLIRLDEDVQLTIRDTPNNNNINEAGEPGETAAAAHSTASNATVSSLPDAAVTATSSSVFDYASMQPGANCRDSDCDSSSDSIASPLVADNARSPSSPSADCESPPSRFSYSCVISTSRRSNSSDDDEEGGGSEAAPSRRSSLGFTMSRSSSCHSFPRYPVGPFLRLPAPLLKLIVDYLPRDSAALVDHAISKQLAFKLKLIINNIN